MRLFSSSKPVQSRPPRSSFFSRSRNPVQPRTSRTGGLFASSKPVQSRKSGGGLFSRKSKPARTHRAAPAAATATAPTAGTTSRRHRGGITGTPHPTRGNKTKSKRGFGLFRRRPRRHEPTAGEKVSGAVTRAKGTVTGDPVAQEAGARRMHGYEKPSRVRRRHQF